MTDIACWTCGWQGPSPYGPTETLFRCPSCYSLGDLSRAIAEAVKRAGRSIASGIEAVVDDSQGPPTREIRRP